MKAAWVTLLVLPLMFVVFIPELSAAEKNENFDDVVDSIFQEEEQMIKELNKLTQNLESSTSEETLDLQDIFKEYPANYTDTTSEETEINGHNVTVKKTVYKQTVDDNVSEGIITEIVDKDEPPVSDDVVNNIKDIVDTIDQASKENDGKQERK